MIETSEEAKTYSAFAEETLLASGNLDRVIPSVKAKFDENPGTPLLIFEDQTGRPVDFDLRGALKEVLARAVPAAPRPGPGRPKLGVVSREVSLLPRHWAWLEQQPSGASAALRRLVDQARKHEPGEQRARLATQAVDRIMSVLAGNLPGYEEASRALYAGNRARFEESIAGWPRDVRAYILGRVEEVFPAGVL